MNKPQLNYSMRTDTTHFVVNVTLDESDFEFGTVITGTADKTIAQIIEANENGSDVYAAVMGSYCPFITEVNNGVRFGVKQEIDGVLLDFRLDCNSSESGEIWTCTALYYPIYDRTTEIPQNSNLNDFVDEGVYYSNSTANTTTLTNRPSDMSNAFRLEVKKTIMTANRMTQTLYPNAANGNFYIRKLTNAGWSAWYKFSGTAV